MNSRTCSSVFGLFVVLSVGACTRSPKTETKLAQPSAVASVAAAPAASAAPQLPGGPLLMINAGQGLGAIRLGATVATIERLMQAPCEVKTAQVCRYLARATEFHLNEQGITERIVAYRKGRITHDAPGQVSEFGFFNGMIPPDLKFGMLPEAIQEHLGKPERIENITGDTPDHTKERHFYKGLVLEYDLYPSTGKLVLSSAAIVR